MRWERLFDELGSRLDEELDAEEAGLAEDEAAHRQSQWNLPHRLAEWAKNAETSCIELMTVGGHRARVQLVVTGPDWCGGVLLGSNARVALPLASIEWLRPHRRGRDDSRGSAPPEVLAERRGLAQLLRALGRSGTLVVMFTARRPWHGTIAHVGADHLDLAVRDPAEPRNDHELVSFPLSTIDHLRY